MNRLISEREFHELQVVGVTHDIEDHRADYFVQRNDLSFPTAKFDTKLMDHMKAHYVPFLFAVRDGQVVWTGPMWKVSRAFLDGLTAKTSADASAQTTTDSPATTEDSMAMQ